MNIKEIKEMINLMNEQGIIELEIEKDGMRVKLKKKEAVQEGAGGHISIEKQRVAHAHQGLPLEATEKISSQVVEIKAPMVGTFYRAPSPESAAYVEVGQVIEPAQVICIIEAMKLMNEIKSEIKGKVTEILVDNAEPVEFGQPMFLIEPL
ncbi:MAG: acetyl-CoA carboxylase biotin carboxyl carrier protein [Candidatus Omnitrophica bacterium]|nr:acetyl-CoA carboxylase biotin carboxyl carrier protein [Candidatus Omnitrophota bacterium]